MYIPNEFLAASMLAGVGTAIVQKIIQHRKNAEMRDVIDEYLCANETAESTVEPEEAETAESTVEPEEAETAESTVEPEENNITEATKASEILESVNRREDLRWLYPDREDFKKFDFLCGELRWFPDCDLVINEDGLPTTTWVDESMGDVLEEILNEDDHPDWKGNKGFVIDMANERKYKVVKMPMTWAEFSGFGEDLDGD